MVFVFVFVVASFEVFFLTIYVFYCFSCFVGKQ